MGVDNPGEHRKIHGDFAEGRIVPAVTPSVFSTMGMDSGREGTLMRRQTLPNQLYVRNGWGQQGWTNLTSLSTYPNGFNTTITTSPALYWTDEVGLINANLFAGLKLAPLGQNGFTVADAVWRQYGQSGFYTLVGVQRNTSGSGWVTMARIPRFCWWAGEVMLRVKAAGVGALYDVAVALDPADSNYLLVSVNDYQANHALLFTILCIPNMIPNPSFFRPIGSATRGGDGFTGWSDTTMPYPGDQFEPEPEPKPRGRKGGA